MRAACGKCGRVYEINDRLAGRAVKIPCRHCGHVTRVEVVATPAPTPAPRPVPTLYPVPRGEGEAKLPIAGAPTPSAGETSFADLLSPTQGSGEAVAPEPAQAPTSLAAADRQAWRAASLGDLPASPELTPVSILTPIPTLAQPPASPGGPASPSPEPIAERPEALKNPPTVATPRRPDGGPDRGPAAVPAPGRPRWALPALMGVVLLAAAGAATWVLTGPTGQGAPPPARQGGLPTSPPTAAEGAPPAEVKSPSQAALAAAPRAEPARGERHEEVATPGEGGRPAAPPAAPPRPKRPPERRTPEVRSPPRVAAPAAPAPSAPVPEAIPPDAVPGRVAMAPPPPRGLEPAPPSSTSSNPNLPPRTDEQVQATLARYARSFDACVAAARQAEPELLASPRPVVVSMLVRPNGRVAYPTLDDAAVSESALGGCLKKQASMMVFAEAGGEPVRLRMPLLLGQ